jgi:hypothetical protein
MASLRCVRGKGYLVAIKGQSIAWSHPDSSSSKASKQTTIVRYIIRSIEQNQDLHIFASVFQNINMRFSTLLLALAFAVTTLAALTTQATRGTLYVTNQCTDPLYIWDVSSTLSDVSTIKPLATWTEKLYFDGKIGTAIKIGTTNTSIWTASPLLNFGYTLNDNEGAVYYDLSTVYGYAPLFQGKTITLTGSPGKKVPEIEWKGEPVPPHTEVFFGDTDLYLTLCA